MGNSESVDPYVGWKVVQTHLEQTKYSPKDVDATELLIRLNIAHPKSQSNQSDKKSETSDEKEPSNVDVKAYLKDFLSKLPTSQLDDLLLIWGIDPHSFTTDSSTKDTNECKDSSQTKRSVSEDSPQLRTEKIDALLCVSHPDFWRTNYTIHPNMKRVKNWLFVHKKYRTQMAEIVEMVKSLLDESTADSREKTLASVKSKFASFNDKLEKHSHFEDTQLFAFIKDKIANSRVDIQKLESKHNEMDSLVSHINDLMTQHSQMSTHAKSMKDFYTKYEHNSESEKSNPITQLVSEIEKFNEELLEHLLLEERNLVHSWLNWTVDEYKLFRSYLSTIYAVAYYAR